MALSDAAEPAIRGSLQIQAYQEVRELIIQQKLRPGAKVSEASLCRLTGYGRAPIRVALRGLVADGLVQIVPQSGVYIGRIEPATELKVLEVRSELERVLTTCAARRGTDEHLRRMTLIAARLRREVPRQPIRFGLLLRDVHEVLTEAADNPFLTSIMARIHALSRRFWYAHRERLGNLHYGAALHAERLEHIARRDLPSAAAASDAIVEFIRSYVLNILGTESAHSPPELPPRGQLAGRRRYQRQR
jgi:DNA-binding GntR family transcriptional regulator